jgi:hypothetical protein
MPSLSPPFLWYFFFSSEMHLERLALQTLLARLAATNGLSPHSPVGCRCLLLLSRVGSRALGTHRPGTGQ